MNAYPSLLLRAALLIGLASIGLLAQPQLEVFQPTPEFLEASKMAENPGYRQQAVEKFQQIAAAQPRTTMAATCLFNAAYYCESPPLAKQIYQQIANDFAGTTFEVHARESALLMEYNAKPDAQRFAVREQLLTSLGVPTVAEIVARPTRALTTLRLKQSAYREAVGDLYSSQAAILNAIGRYSEALAVAKFGRELYQAYPQLENQFRGEVGRSYIYQFGLNGKLPLPRPVPIHLSLKATSGRMCGRPLIQGEAHTGDFSTKKIYLTFSTITLDNVDIRPELNLIFDYPRKLRPGQVFEKIYFSYQPKQRLAPGPHQLKIHLVTGSEEEGPTADKVLNFTVDHRLPDDRDDDETEQDRRRKSTREE